MIQLIEVKEVSNSEKPTPDEIHNCSLLETGHLLLFSQNMPTFQENEIKILETITTPVSYQISSGSIAIQKKNSQEQNALRAIMLKYLNYAKLMLGQTMPHYLSRAHLDKIILTPTSQNSLPPSFSFTPCLDGNRILTFFTNISTKPLLWSTSSENFSSFVKKFMEKHQNAIPAKQGGEVLKEKIARKMKVKIREYGGSRFKSPYDCFMSKMIKELNSSSKIESSMLNWQILPSQSCLFFSDAILHAPLENQITLSLTLELPRYRQLNPETSCMSILERLTEEVMMAPFSKKLS